MIAATTVFAVGLPGLLVDGFLNDFNQRLCINGADCEHLGINGDGLGGMRDELGQNGVASCLR